MDTFNLLKLKAELERDEGRRSKPYEDTEGILTIGVGWNLEERGLPQEIIDRLFEISISDAERDALALFPSFRELDPALVEWVIQLLEHLSPPGEPGEPWARP